MKWFSKKNKNQDQNTAQEISDLVDGYEASIHIQKTNTLYKRTRMSNFGLKLNRFYSQMPMWKIMVITIVTALFFGVISVFFVKNVGIYNFGLAAFGQSASKIIVVNLTQEQVSATVRNLIDQFVFWVAYIILSIPIFVFGYKKVGKLFTNITILFLVVSSLVSFGIGLIPGANSVYLIGDYSNADVKMYLSDYKKDLSGIIPLQWTGGDAGSVIALMLYSIVYGYVLAYIFAIIQIIGGTAGVTGVIGEWYANAKQKSFGAISGYMNIVIVFIAVAIGSWLPGSILLKDAQANMQLAQKQWDAGLETIKQNAPANVEALKTQIADLAKNIKENIGIDLTKFSDYQNIDWNNAYSGIKANEATFADNIKLTKSFAAAGTLFSKAWSFELYLSPNFVATILVNVVYIMMLDKLYPKFKLVRVQIFTKNAEQVRSMINNDNKIVTGMTIFPAKGGYKGEDLEVITSIALFRHVLRIIKDVRSVDPDAFISVSDIKSIDGNIYLPEDKF
ncbi:YitT family protein [Mycoplasma seminis]|uniref:YitT family protein n=1 Tax=Mycoplasma seminis TaxID=512749 RepID=A0ABY9HAS3_9MOLU|nr:YitT family protein [Mycoplasma seminis]WLP85669.1 YitT family protein [Mycoplasma seminis]